MNTLESVLNTYRKMCIKMNIKTTAVDEAFYELKAKDQEIERLVATATRLMDSQDDWIAERIDLQAVIEKQGERIRYLEKQYRDLNPKEMN